ncbi:hypothetical protein [Cupriavidus campinensis]|uniref:hypothetical protein n=1 Tax=Cupriavidus campinensis TaxID=151783 RepID=UPI0011F0581F|nr:hypothetical protein [Cupriavidus campinensis]
MKVGASRLTRALYCQVKDDVAAMHQISVRCRDPLRFTAWARGERRYVVERRCAKCGSQSRLVRDGSCAGCAANRSPLMLTPGGKLDKAAYVFAADGRQRVGRNRWRDQCDAERAERCGEFREVQHGKYVARIHPTGRLEVQEDSGWRTDDLAKLAREQGDVFFRFAQGEPDLVAVMADAGWY